VTYLAVYLRGRKIAIDDTLDVWLGTEWEVLRAQFLTGFFAEKAVNAAGNNGLLLVIASARRTDPAVAAVGIYSFAATWVILKVLVAVKFPLRVTSMEEQQGLDMAAHGETAYQHVIL